MTKSVERWLWLAGLLLMQGGPVSAATTWVRRDPAGTEWTAVQTSNGTVNPSRVDAAVERALKAVAEDRWLDTPASGETLEEILSSRLGDALNHKLRLKEGRVFGVISNTVASAEALLYTVKGSSVPATAERQDDGVRLTVTVVLKDANLWRLQPLGEKPPYFDPELIAAANRYDWHPFGQFMVCAIEIEAWPRSAKFAALKGHGWSISMVRREVFLSELRQRLLPDWPSCRVLWNSMASLEDEVRRKQLEALGTPDALALLGAQRLQGSNADQEASVLIKRAAEGGSREGAFLYGDVLLREGLANDSALTLQNAAGYYGKAALLGDLDAGYRAQLIGHYITNRFAVRIPDTPTFAPDFCPAKLVAEGKLKAWQAQSTNTSRVAARVLSREAYLKFLEAARLGDPEGTLLAGRCITTGFGADADDNDALMALDSLRQQIENFNRVRYPIIVPPKGLTEAMTKALQDVQATSLPEITVGGERVTTPRWPAKGQTNGTIVFKDGTAVQVTLMTSATVTAQNKDSDVLRSLVWPRGEDINSLLPGQTQPYYGAPWWGSGKENGTFFILTNNTTTLTRKDGAIAHLVVLQIQECVLRPGGRRGFDGTIFFNCSTGERRGVLAGAIAQLGQGRSIRFQMSVKAEDWPRTKTHFHAAVKEYIAHEGLPDLPAFTTSTPFIPL